MKTFSIFKNILIIIVAFGVTVSLMGILKNKIGNSHIENNDLIINDSESEVAPQDSPIELISLKGVKIFIDKPSASEAVMQSLVLKGRAPGNWFFEANAPVVVTNWDGLIIGEGYVMTEEDWMTTDYVPFSGSINFTNTEYGDYGFVIFKKDNPSGESQFDDSVEFKVLFK
ncbi:MAG: hypothetical protein QG580_281 [Patescibacteria group bacterium]|jgi:hypothetical protein|nr:hypothetical protein [Patescibacteria group bacterium]